MRTISFGAYKIFKLYGEKIFVRTMFKLSVMAGLNRFLRASLFQSTGYSIGYQKTGKAMKPERKIHGKPRWRPERQEKSERGAKNRLHIHCNSKPNLLLSGGRKPQWQQGQRRVSQHPFPAVAQFNHQKKIRKVAKEKPSWNMLKVTRTNPGYANDLVDRRLSGCKLNWQDLFFWFLMGEIRAYKRTSLISPENFF